MNITGESGGSGVTQADIDSAIAVHVGLPDPHPVYILPAEGDAAYQPLNAQLTTLAAGISSVGQTLVAGANAAAMLATLTAQGTGAKDQANGYPGLSAGSLIAPAQMGSGSSITTKFLRGDGTWQTLAGGGDLLSTNNLSDLADKAVARTNLQLDGKILAAGSASAASWPVLPSGTLLTASEAGAIERDANCFYLTTDAGNRAIARARNFIRLAAARTFVSDTNQQAIFDSPSNGTLTLETGVYTFECQLYMTGMSATSGNGKFSLLGAGGATLASILWHALGQDAAAEAAGSAVGGSAHIIATETGANIVTAGTGTTVSLRIKGTFEVTVAGTIIPSFAQTTAAAAVVAKGSYFSCERVGATGLVSVGQWD